MTNMLHGRLTRGQQDMERGGGMPVRVNRSIASSRALAPSLSLDRVFLGIR